MTALDITSTRKRRVDREGPVQRAVNEKFIHPETLRKLLRHDPEAGRLYWRERTPDMFSSGIHTAGHTCAQWNSRFAGQEAMTAVNNGYRHGDIWSKKYRAHRVIWALQYGEWPPHQIDHIDGDRANNRISNLRLATAYQNLCNRPAQINNKSGIKGVSWHGPSNLWRATIVVRGKQKSLGYYKTAEAAHLAYCDGALKFHGDYANMGGHHAQN